MRLLSEWAQKLEKMRRDETHVFQFNFVFSKILSALKQITTHKYICIYIYKCNAKNACRWILPSLFPWNDWTHGVRANNAVKISLQHFAVVNTSVIPTPHLSSSSPLLLLLFVQIWTWMNVRVGTGMPARLFIHIGFRFSVIKYGGRLCGLVVSIQLCLPQASLWMPWLA